MNDFRLFNNLQALLDSPTDAKQLFEPNTVDAVTDNKNQPVSCKLSVVIVAYNESVQEINDCLHSLQVTINHEPFELVAVDNGLQNDAANILRSSAHQYIKTKSNLGCCGGRNLGASFCNGRVLMFVDADGILEQFDPTSIDKITGSSLIAIRGKVLSDNSENPPPHYNPGNCECPSLIDAEGISLWDRELFVSAGGFNEDLKGNEGIVLAFRLIKYYSAHSNQFYYMPTLQLRHDFAANTRFKGQTKQKYYYIQFLYLRKIYPGIETFVREQLKLRNGNGAKNRRYFLSRLGLYITRITTGAKFKLYLLYKNIQ